VLPLAGCDSGGANDGDDTSGSVTAPSNFTATAQSDGTVDLSWDGVSGAASYNVYRSTSTISDVSVSVYSEDITSTSYTDSDNNTSDGATYYYYATSVSEDGVESSLSSSGKVTIATTPSGGGGSGSGSSDSWTLVKTETDNTIEDVAITSEGAYAVASGGILLKRTSDKWKKVLNNGPSSNSNDLNGIAVTDGGDHVWFVGASGAIGEWDVTTGSLVKDHSAPNDVTNNFADVTVTGNAGSARIQIADKSGKVLYSTDDGGTWTQVGVGNGSAHRAIDTYGPQSGYLANGNQSVFETTDAGNSWTRKGIANANVAFYGIDSDATDDVWLAGGNGTVYRWNGSTWTPNSIGEPDLQDLEVAGDNQNGYASGGSGAIFIYDGSAWSKQETPNTANLNAIVLETSSTPAIAVGAGGTILER